MKNLFYFPISVILLSGSYNCSGEAPEVYSFCPEVTIEYVDKEGDALKGLLENEDVINIKNQIVTDHETFEIVSITNNEGNTVKLYADEVVLGYDIKRPPRPAFAFGIEEIFTLKTAEMVREYTIRYKVPIVLGKDHVEELKLVYNVEGTSSHFSQAWYNGLEIKNLIDGDSLFRKYLHPSAIAIDEDAIKDELDKMLYTGKPTLLISGDVARLVLPIDKYPPLAHDFIKWFKTPLHSSTR